MIPITAGTLAGVNAPGRTRRRTLGLTLTYVGGLSLFYALLGMIAGMTGSLFGTIGASFWARLVIGNLLLVVVGFFSGALAALPRAGAWMSWIKKAAGVVLLLMAEYYFVKAGQVW